MTAANHQGPLRPGGYSVHVGWYAGETLALLGEAAVCAGVSRERGVGHALVASAVANAVSYGAGITLLWLAVGPR